ncbi:LysR family transcriptional regulator [Saccharibacillus alkalitolerans]|uniref:LysR family transcriptional regulator n=1 Tax=Saccharibacillus alkalitolerans TaxID=2705290 RepID=A0ABX0F7X5_9BACL|nr:LysR family transcriptional regulator [Saccharibacillus alkalitolerans]NGZ76495.1 LysR family transcriptional regulator [Saccharibacillus alkalitolerans]
MDMRKIRYLIDLVECRSFTETARKNFVSQTTVSQQIAALEDEFGARLIDRKQTPIEPTEAGMLFYREAVLLWKQYARMKTNMDNYRSRQARSLSIRYAAVTDVQNLLPRIPSFRSKHPDIRLELNKGRLKDAADHLQKGICDVALAFDSEFAGRPDIRTVPLYEGRYCAAVGTGHPLHALNSIPKEELYRHPLVMLNQDAIGGSYDLMIEHAAQDGYRPDIARSVDDVETELFYIVTELLIGFFPERYELPALHEDIRLIPIEDSHHAFRIEAGYLAGNANPALAAFLDHLREPI